MALSELGHYALILALALAFIQIIFGSRKAVFGQFLLIIFAFVIHKGPLLLWISILSFWTLLVSLINKNLEEDFYRTVLRMLGFLSAGFLLFAVTLSNPFEHLLFPDPNLVFYSPLLYMGYAGFAIPFAFAIAALISGKLDPVWARAMRPWTLFAWCFLTLGMTLESWYFYHELELGNWWFWDPIENASLMPWLSGIALIHSLIVSEKRNAFYHWTILLAMLTFSLSLLGTFLIRSGILLSIHAFAQDPDHGKFLLDFLFVVIGIAFLIYAVRSKKLDDIQSFSLLSREGFLFMNNILLLVSVAIILLGTLYPLISDLNLGGVNYFNKMFVPLSMLILFCMGLGPLCHWGNMSWENLKRPLLINLVISIIFAFFISVGVALGLFAMMTIFRHIWMTRKTLPSLNRLGMWLAHIGIGVCVISISLSYVTWIWIGGILIFLGGLSSALSQRYYR